MCVAAFDVFVLPKMFFNTLSKVMAHLNLLILLSC